MKKAKRIISLFLSAIIVASSIGYAPPAAGAVDSPSAFITREYPATPSEAVRPDEKATPSDAAPPKDKSTPSEAEKTFVREDPEEVPEYYTKATCSGKTFWKFRDRYENVQYRIYGYVQGEAEIPSWYETDNQGNIAEGFQPINVDDEYYDLAPYIWSAVDPSEENWENLNTQQSVEIYSKEKLYFNNWDGSQYIIWYVEANKIHGESTYQGDKYYKDIDFGMEDEQEKVDLYFLYGFAKNVTLKEESRWIESDTDGNILLNRPVATMAMGAKAAYSTLDDLRIFKHIPGTVDYSADAIRFSGLGKYTDGYLGYSGNLNPVYYNDIANLQLIEFPELEHDGYTFLGYIPDVVGSLVQDKSQLIGSNSFSERLQSNPELFDYFIGYDPYYSRPGRGSYPAMFNSDVKDGMDFVTGFIVIPGGSKITVRSLLGGLRRPSVTFHGIWLKDDLASLTLIDEVRDINSYWITMNGSQRVFYDQYKDLILEDAPYYRSISFKKHGEIVDISNLLESDPAKGYLDGGAFGSSTVIHHTKHAFGGYWSELDGQGKKLSKIYTYDKSNDKYYAYWIPIDETFTVTYQDERGNAIGGIQTINAGGKSIPPEAPGKPGYQFVGWKSQADDGSAPDLISRDTIFVTEYQRENVSIKLTFKDWDETILSESTVNYGDVISFPQDPYREEHTFIGWDRELGTISELLEDTVVTAQYKLNLFDLTLVGNGGIFDGKSSERTSISYGESFDELLSDGMNSAARTYYTFAGWYTAPVGGSKYPEAGNIMQNASLTIYAHWARTSSLVTYKDWNGSTLKVQEVAIGTDVVPPADPTRPGYTFTGWDQSSENIQNHTVITAQYSINGYKLTLDGNGGTLEGEVSKEYGFSYGESFDQALADGKNSAARPYYTFAGWYTAPVGGSQYPETGNTMPDSSLAIYAHWSRNSSQVTYKDWDDEILETQVVAIGADAVPPANPTRPGYTFTGWDKQSTNIQDHLVITAQYSTNSYKLNLYGNGGSLEGESSKEHERSYGESLDQILINEKNSAARTYYTFAGWYSAPIGGSPYPETGNRMPNSNLALYTHWTRSSSQVTYKNWNGDTLETQVVAIGGNATPPVSPIRAGYTFDGWDQSSTNIQTHTVITAQYSINGYKLTLDGNGGTLEGHTSRELGFSYGESFDQALDDGKNSADRTYYSFAGWYTAPIGGSQYVDSGNTMPASNVTVYAHWVRNSSQVIYIDWDGREIDKQEIIVGGNAAPPTNPARLGYTFTGWDKPSTNIQDHTIVTAQYLINTYKLILDGNGGTMEGQPLKEFSISYRDSIDQILADGKTAVSHPGYTFVGWYTAPAGGITYANIGNAMPANDVTIYAHWEASKEPTEPTKPEPTEPKPTPSDNSGGEKEAEKTKPVPSTIDSKTKPEVPDSGGSFVVNPENPSDVSYTKPDGTPAKDEWIGDGEDWYHVDTDGKLNYDWFLEGENTWYKLSKTPGDKFGAALVGWNYEPMDDKRYFFDPNTTKMFTGWQHIDGKWHYFTTQNDAQTYFGNNRHGWLYDLTKPGKPYGSMYQNEKTPDGYQVDGNGVLIN